MKPQNKIAILFNLFGENLATEILKQLDKGQAHRVLSAMSQLTSASEEDVEQVCKELLEILKKGPTSHSHQNKSAGILAAASKVLNDDSWLKDSETGVLVAEIKEVLEQLDARVLGGWLTKERPSTIASVLSLAEPKLAASTFKFLEASLHTEICLSISKLSQVDEPGLRIIHSEIVKLQRQSARTTQVGGREQLAKLLQSMQTGDREALLVKLEEKDLGLTEEIRRSLLSVGQLAQLLPADLAKLCAKLSDKDLVILMYKEKEDVKLRFLAAVSKTRRENIECDIQNLSALRRSEYEKVFTQLLSVANELKAKGQIIFPWEEELVS